MLISLSIIRTLLVDYMHNNSYTYSVIKVKKPSFCFLQYPVKYPQLPANVPEPLNWEPHMTFKQTGTSCPCLKATNPLQTY